MSLNFNLQQALQGLLEMVSLELQISMKEAGKVIKKAAEEAPFYLSPMRAKAGELTVEDEFNALKKALGYILDEAKGEGDIKERRKRLEERIGTTLQYETNEGVGELDENSMGEKRKLN